MAANMSTGAKSAGMSLRLNWMIPPERVLLYVKLYILFLSAPQAASK
jgi:hypothetical protein